MRAAVAAMIALIGAATPASAQSDPLPSWRNGAAKAAIIESVVRVTTPGDVGFVYALRAWVVGRNPRWIRVFEGPEQVGAGLSLRVVAGCNVNWALASLIQIDRPGRVRQPQLQSNPVSPCAK